MSYICYYITCGLCCKKEFIKSQKTDQSMNTLKALKEIEAERDIGTNVKLSSPSRIETAKMSKVYNIPSNEFETETDVFKYRGYVIGGYIDSGTFASIYKAKHIRKDVIIACKTIELPIVFNRESKRYRTKILKDMKNELFILEKTSHPHIIRLIEHFFINNRLFIFMQFASGGNLSKLLDSNGPFREDTCKTWFAQMLSAICYMHSTHSMAHRDLKLSNILLDESQDVLVSDFGLSRIAFCKSKKELIESKTYCGTPLYMSPELYDIDRNKTYNAFKADVWALGVILYNLFNNNYPYNIREGKKKVLNAMKSKQWKHSGPFAPTPQLNDILCLMFEPNPNKRITTYELKSHAWIAEEYKKVEIHVKRFEKNMQ